ncbi:MAG: hypothetical protein ACI9R3_005621 [Verrucomicrobiales bacterium]|jgi:hypothetical protein
MISDSRSRVIAEPYHQSESGIGILEKALLKRDLPSPTAN